MTRTSRSLAVALGVVMVLSCSKAALAASPAEEAVSGLAAGPLAEQEPAAAGGVQRRWRPRWGYLLTGSLVFTLTYGASAAMASTRGDSAREQAERNLWIPVVGPFLVAETEFQAARQCTWLCGFDQLAGVAALVDGLSQVVGLCLIAAGLLLETSLVNPPSVSLGPLVHPGASGFSASVRF